MKTLYLILSACLITSASLLHATAVEDNGLSAPLPEWKTPPQLKIWRAETTARTLAKEAADRAAQVKAVANSATPSGFYTGKPYMAESGTYAFKYREYNPEMARWTTVDPSGFPDGANNRVYAAVPTSELDYQGLLKWSTLTESMNPDNTPTMQSWSHAGNSLLSEVWTVKTNDGNSTITLWNNTTGGLDGIDNYGYNCHGYTFGNSIYWINGQVDIILSGDGYKLITGDNKTGARVAYWGDDVHSAMVNSVDDSGTVTSVTGKLGAGELKTSAPADQGYSGTVQYYE